jgi:hypothetical protein
MLAAMIAQGSGKAVAVVFMSMPWIWGLLCKKLTAVAESNITVKPVPTG